MKRYLLVWFRLAHISFAEQLATRFSSLLFILGKTLRFVFFLVFILGLVNRTGGLSGYSRDQIILFFLVFNLVDMTTQLFFRGVYYFRHKVVSGELDFFLVKPMHPLFRVMAGYTDILDLVTLVALLGYMAWFLPGSSIVLTISDLVITAVMLVISFVVSFSIHVLVVSIGVLTTEVDHSIMIYRDLTQMARIPVDIYAGPVRVFLTYLIPVALMITTPARALMGLVSPVGMMGGLAAAGLFLWLALRYWQFALSRYSSASS